MKPIQTIFSVLVLAVVLAVTCEREENISEIPAINFKALDGPFQVITGGVTAYGAELVFKFRDGNSDFGVDMSTRPEDTINLYMIPFQKIDGVYDSIDADLYGRTYTIKRDPKMENGDGPIKGEINVLITYFFRPPFDTMRYDFYILDRAGNKSNVESTSDISF